MKVISYHEADTEAWLSTRPTLWLTKGVRVGTHVCSHLLCPKAAEDGVMTIMSKSEEGKDKNVRPSTSSRRWAFPWPGMEIPADGGCPLLGSLSPSGTLPPADVCAYQYKSWVWLWRSTLQVPGAVATQGAIGFAAVLGEMLPCPGPPCCFGQLPDLLLPRASSDGALVTSPGCSVHIFLPLLFHIGVIFAGSHLFMMLKSLWCKAKLFCCDKAYVRGMKILNVNDFLIVWIHIGFLWKMWWAREQYFTDQTQIPTYEPFVLIPLP